MLPTDTECQRSLTLPRFSPLAPKESIFLLAMLSMAGIATKEFNPEGHIGIGIGMTGKMLSIEIAADTQNIAANDHVPVLVLVHFHLDAPVRNHPPPCWRHSPRNAQN